MISLFLVSTKKFYKHFYDYEFTESSKISTRTFVTELGMLVSLLWFSASFFDISWRFR